MFHVLTGPSCLNVDNGQTPWKAHGLKLGFFPGSPSSLDETQNNVRGEPLLRAGRMPGPETPQSWRAGGHL